MTTRAPLGEAPTTELLKEVLEGTRDLARLEVRLGRDEAIGELKAAAGAAIGFGVAAGFVVLAVTMCAVALVLAIGPTPLAALTVAGAFVVVALVAAAVGYAALPKTPLAATRRRVEEDVAGVRERMPGRSPARSGARLEGSVS